MATRNHTAEAVRPARERHLGKRAPQVADPLSKLSDAVQREMLKTVHIKSAKGGDYVFVLHRAASPPSTKSANATVLKDAYQKKAKAKSAPKAVDAFRESVSKALRSVLLRDDSDGRILRLQLVQQLASPELNEPHAVELSMPFSEPAPVEVEVDDPLLTTSEAARRLGFSRAHIAMLVDADRLRAEHKSEGGHRRIRLSEVFRYQQELQVKRKGSADPKEVAQEAGMYAIPDSEWVAVSREQRALEPVTPKAAGTRARRPASMPAARQSKTRG